MFFIYGNNCLDGLIDRLSTSPCCRWPWAPWWLCWARSPCPGAWQYDAPSQTFYNNWSENENDAYQLGFKICFRIQFQIDAWYPNNNPYRYFNWKKIVIDNHNFYNTVFLWQRLRSGSAFFAGPNFYVSRSALPHRLLLFVRQTLAVLNSPRDRYDRSPCRLLTNIHLFDSLEWPRSKIRKDSSTLHSDPFSYEENKFLRLARQCYHLISPLRSVQNHLREILIRSKDNRNIRFKVC